MSVFFITLILFVVFFVVKVRKVLNEPLQESEQVCDLEIIEDREDTLQEQVSYTYAGDVVKNVYKEDVEIEQIEKQEKQILSVEHNKKFSLKEAVIYSAILERPYK